MSTPIFDSVMRDQEQEIMPLPATETHEQFMTRHEQNEWLGLCDEILAMDNDNRKDDS